MKIFKYLVALMAVACLVSALLPSTGTVATVPEWIGRAIYIADAVLLGIIFYGLQVRRPTYWKLIPILLITYVLSILIGALWSLIQLSLPWLPFLFIIVLFLIGLLIFGAWWRQQRSYFAQA